MTTIIIMIIIGYFLHLLYKLLDFGFLFLSNAARKIKPKKEGKQV